MDQLRKAFVRLPDREISDGKTISIVSAGRIIHIAGTCVPGRVHGNDDERLVHLVGRNSLLRILHTPVVIAAHRRSVAEPAAQRLTAMFIPFRRGNDLHRTDVEQMPEGRIRFFGEEGIRHLPHHGIIGTIGYLPVREGITHQHQFDSVSVTRLLEVRHLAVLRVVGRHVIVRLFQVIVDIALDPVGVFGPRGCRLVLLLVALRDIDDQVVSPPLGPVVIGFRIGRRRIGTKIQFLKGIGPPEAISSHLRQTRRQCQALEVGHVGERIVMDEIYLVRNRQTLNGGIAVKDTQENALHTVRNPVLRRTNGRYGNQILTIEHQTVVVVAGTLSIEELKVGTVREESRVEIAQGGRESQGTEILPVCKNVAANLCHALWNHIIGHPLSRIGDHASIGDKGPISHHHRAVSPERR